MAINIWCTSDFDRKLHGGLFPSIMECAWLAKDELGEDELREFVDALWECWKSCNQFFFGNRRSNLRDAAEKT